MFELIDRLRQKTDGQKKRIAFFSAFFICLIIFIFWVFTVLPDFKKQEQIDKKMESVKTGPTTNFSGMFKDSFGQIKKQISEMKGFSSGLEHYSATTSSSTTTENSMIFSSTTAEETL